MNRVDRVLVVLFFSLCLQPLGALAQESCPDLVEQALTLTEGMCAETGRNQICYGHSLLEVETHPDAGDITFDQAGDIVGVNAIQTMRSSALDLTESVWGVALLRLQANLPDTLPGQNVTILLFGDVQLADAVSSRTTLPAIANGNVNIRRTPDTSALVVGSLTSGESVQVFGRLADNGWLLTEFADGAGWVFAELLTVEGDISTLAVTDPAAPIAVNPMQAFYFTAGIGETPCAEAPDSGILIQTPDGVGEVQLTVNGVNVNLHSTAYLRAQHNGYMILDLLEGRARIEAFQVAWQILANMRVRIHLNQHGDADSPPEPPEVCDVSDLEGVPALHGNCTEAFVIINEYCPAVIPARMNIRLHMGSGYASEPEAQAALEQAGTSISINGENMAVTRFGPYPAPPAFAYGTEYLWEHPEAGVYNIVGVEPNGTRTCEVTVLEP